MNELYLAAAEIQDFCNRQKWKFCFIGGLAVVRWGRPRQTNDVDLALLTGFERESEFVDSLLGSFASRVSEPQQFAIENRILLLTASSGIPIDLSLAGLPFEEAMIGRATDWNCLDELHLRTASADDMIVLKAFASRPQDWFDVEQIIARQGDSLDWELILRDLQPLCELKDAPDIVKRLIELRDRLNTE